MKENEFEINNNNSKNIVEEDPLSSSDLVDNGLEVEKTDLTTEDSVDEKESRVPENVTEDEEKEPLLERSTINLPQDDESGKPLEAKGFGSDEDEDNGDDIYLDFLPRAEEKPAEEIENLQFAKLKGKERRKFLRKHITEITLENDVRYRGPLSYRYLRIAGWIFLMFAQYGVLLGFSSKINPEAATNSSLLSVLYFCKNMVMPLFLLATFATILNGSKTLKSMIALYSGATVLVYALFLLVHERYLGGLVSTIFELDHGDAVAFVDRMIFNLNGSRYLTFNIFVDLLMCTLVYNFWVYKPKRVFVGKKLLIYRSFTLLPVLYELLSFELKVFASYGVINLPIYVYPVLTNKPPMTFLVFVLLVVFIKMRERLYRKSGKSHEQYLEFLKTNANSYQFSRFTAKLMLIAGLIDVIISFILVIIVAVALSGGSTESEAISAAFSAANNMVIRTGIGESASLIILSPLVFLFSYTRTHKDTRFDTILPVVAVVILLIVYLEGIYHILSSSYEKIKGLIDAFFGASLGL